MSHLVIDPVQYELEYNSSMPFYKLIWDTGSYDLMDRIGSVGTSINIVNISNGIAKEIVVDIEIENIYDFIEEFKQSMAGQDITFNIGDHPTFKNSDCYGQSGNQST